MNGLSRLLTNKLVILLTCLPLAAFFLWNGGIAPLAFGMPGRIDFFQLVFAANLIACACGLRSAWKWEIFIAAFVICNIVFVLANRLPGIPVWGAILIGVWNVVVLAECAATLSILENAPSALPQ